ncbi:hypothetical protein OG709_35750 (plasmid) [Streptomyces sp. NBC_01267]|uniref:hypothetical protein n=1 Tax=Streptomyces sp. NBC_01267 TaxID=2903805 RepID=UPI002E35E815|nr:hypothetical protein [Streptomyces sp. NBC_01267]
MARPDDLYARYMAAHTAWAAHRTNCTNCRTRRPCPAGAQLVERFARLQDAYLQHQRNP